MNYVDCRGNLSSLWENKLEISQLFFFSREYNMQHIACTSELDNGTNSPSKVGLLPPFLLNRSNFF